MSYILYLQYDASCNVEVGKLMLNIKDRLKYNENIKREYKYSYNTDIYINICLKSHLSEDDFTEYAKNIKEILKYDANIAYKYKKDKDDDVKRYKNNNIIKPTKLKFIDDD